MRDIKFRAWCTAEDNTVECDGEIVELEVCTWEEMLSMGMGGFFYGDYLLMQYTGKKDINNTEIYVLDVIEGSYNGEKIVGEVIDSEKYGHYAIKSMEEVNIFCLDDIKIIGESYTKVKA